MHLTGKHINYYHICHRKLWLFHSGISFQQTHANVADGTLLHETAYPQRAKRYREVQLDGIKIDFYDPQERVVHEIKRSNKLEHASIAQLQYYLRVLERHGIENPTGLLEYPKIRRTERVVLTDADRAAIEQWEAAIEQLVNLPSCPPVINKPFCKQCSYYEFCYVSEAGVELDLPPLSVAYL
ncbi:CRISPR-associated protein Cas4 [Hymenobacter sp. ASUV-10]|uniref:CRISPR-associated exonuclease Cas4 n=1 Tax=Hymenobacter aranciens TaxID=3063996 RepID=A0ABT9BDK9_9BACT|nr:CRISPR-associated protein Cas4 [Hymenobacter sp. ASUV-10]MDO7876345.1 CRISPR-associated protein Cas4 [Hymenobacter sp. ASUV-10]